jgi:hypothetical protein
MPNKKGEKAMHPTTFKGWYNTLVRGHPYNEKTAYILDHTFKTSTRFLSTMKDRNGSIYPSILRNKTQSSLALFTTPMV